MSGNGKKNPRSNVGEEPRVREPSQAGFIERTFVSGFMELIDDGKHELALEYLLTNTSKLCASRLNRKEKFNHMLFMCRLVQVGGNQKYGFEKLTRKLRQIADHLQQAALPPSSTFLDFGCGVHDPIAMSTYFYLNGFNRAIACDLSKPRNPVYSAFSMYDILANMAIYPERYLRPGANAEVFHERLRAIASDQFATGNFDGGLQSLEGKVDYRVESILDLDVADQELGLAVSFAVLEHVDDIVAVMEWLFRKSKPGAMQYHFIDMADHRSYSLGGATFNPWSFLTEDDAPRSMNRLRKSEHIEAITRAGFEIMGMKAVENDIPAETAAKLLPRWRAMSDEDRRTIKLHVALRRPV